MQTVTLLPVTKRLKQIVKEFGTTWSVLTINENLPAFNGDPGVMIRSLNEQHTRWVRPTQIEELSA